MKNEKNSNTFAVLLPCHKDDDYLQQSIDSTLSGVPNRVNLYISVHKNEMLYAKLKRNYNYKNIRLLNDTKSKNLAEVLNTGLAEVKENFIFRMDSDDIWMANRFALQSEYVKFHPTVAMVASGIAVNNELHGKEYFVAVKKTAKITLHDLLVGCPIAHPTVLYKKSAVLNVGGYNTKINYAEDYDLWLRMVERHQIHVTTDIVLKYRYHKKSTSNIYSKEQHGESVHIKFNAAYRYLKIPVCQAGHNVNESLGCRIRFNLLRLILGVTRFFLSKNVIVSRMATLAEIQNLVNRYRFTGVH